MKLNHLQRPSFIRLGIAEALIVILTVVLYLPVAFARHRAAGGDFGVFRVTGTSDVTFSGIRVENGKPAGIAAGGAIAHDGIGIVNTLASPNVNGSPLPKSFGNLAPSQWSTTVVIFSGKNQSSGAKRTLTFAGSYTGGTFNEKWKVTRP
jgi:hypothetical protein